MNKTQIIIINSYMKNTGLLHGSPAQIIQYGLHLVAFAQVGRMSTFWSGWCVVIRFYNRDGLGKYQAIIVILPPNSNACVIAFRYGRQYCEMYHVISPGDAAQKEAVLNTNQPCAVVEDMTALHLIKNTTYRQTHVIKF